LSDNGLFRKQDTACWNYKNKSLISVIGAIKWVNLKEIYT